MYDKLYRPMDWKQNEPLYSLEWLQFFPVSFVHFMVFNATFNNISATSWRSVLLVEETRVPRENHRTAVSHWQTLSQHVVLNKPLMRGIRTHNVSGDRYIIVGFVWIDIIFLKYIVITICSCLKI
jgi:hypothetical protein